MGPEGQTALHRTRRLLVSIEAGGLLQPTLDLAEPYPPWGLRLCCAHRLSAPSRGIAAGGPRRYQTVVTAAGGPRRYQTVVTAARWRDGSLRYQTGRTVR